MTAAQDWKKQRTIPQLKDELFMAVLLDGLEGG